MWLDYERTCLKFDAEGIPSYIKLSHYDRKPSSEDWKQETSLQLRHVAPVVGKLYFYDSEGNFIT